MSVRGTPRDGDDKLNPRLRPMKRARRSTLWKQFFQLNADSPLTIQTQLQALLIAAIGAGRIPLDRPVPSSRELAGQLGIARNTVVIVYQQLADDGYLIARTRLGYFANPGGAARRLRPALQSFDGLGSRHQSRLCPNLLDCHRRYAAGWMRARYAGASRLASPSSGLGTPGFPARFISRGSTAWMPLFWRQTASRGVAARATAVRRQFRPSWESTASRPVHRSAHPRARRGRNAGESHSRPA